jgi:hypothetical protein
MKKLSAVVSLLLVSGIFIPGLSIFGQVIISEFRTRGPSGANDEFVELYNNSDGAVDIGGWRIKRSSSGAAVLSILTIASGTILPARSHFLATNNGYSGSVPGDQTYGSSVADDGGIGLCLSDDATIVDQVGMSSGSAFLEGATLAPLTASLDQSYERKPGGSDPELQDTQDNADDFQVISPSDPQNLSSTPLPIQLASCTASVLRGSDVEVQWKTVSETNNFGFEIHRRRGDSGPWTKMGFVEGYGTTLAPQSYSYLDRSVPFGMYQYRVRQIDLDGRTEIFPEMEVNVGLEPVRFVLAQNYPNPFNPSTTIEFIVPQAGRVTLKVYNLLGQEVATLQDGNVEANNVYAKEFSAGALASGLYYYQLRGAGTILTKRMLLLR